MSTPSFHLVDVPLGWRVGRFHALEQLAAVTHAVTTRDAVDVHLLKDNRLTAARQIADALRLDGVAFAEQVHGASVRRVHSPGLAGECDALITDQPGLGVMAVSADCVCVLLAERAGRFAGVAHASWRGTVAGVTREMCSAMVAEFGAVPEDLVAAIAPSAGPCCYEVGAEIREAALRSLGGEAERFFLPRAEEGKWLFDLWAANTAQLRAFGLGPWQVHRAEVCTICNGGAFCSHRRDGASAGRFAAVVAPHGGA
jgi:hypothetical protein